MYKWSPYYRSRHYRSKYWSPYNYRYNTYRWSPLYNRYRWTPRYYRYLCDRYYNYRWSPSYCRYYFDDLYIDLKTKMDMFKSFLDYMPKSRSTIVNDLEIPEDILKNRPYAGVDEELSSIGSVSSVCTLNDLARPKSPLDTDSSLSLSRALTASEIDYELFRRYKNRRRSDPFYEIRNVIEAFPEEYLVSINNFQSKPSEVTEQAATLPRERPLYNEDLIRRMERYFDEECTVFGPDDSGLLDLEDALQSIDLKTLDLDLI